MIMKNINWMTVGLYFLVGNFNTLPNNKKFKNIQELQEDFLS